MSASAGDSDRARLLILKGLDVFAPVGSGLEILRWIIRTPVSGWNTLSSRLFWDRNREGNGDSGRGSAPLTS